MEDNTEKTAAEDWMKNIPFQTENIAFKAEELIACRKCGRKNAPTRLKCLYCGAEFEFDELQNEFVKPVLRKVEFWEKGFNLIYLPDDKGLNDERQSEIARQTRLEKSFFRKVSEIKLPLPIARIESLKETEIVKKRLSEIGIATFIVSDEDFDTEKPPKRLRGLEFNENNLRLKLFNTEEIIEIPSDDLVLIVAGAIFERRVASTEKRSRKGENQLLSAAETASDKTLLDVFSREDPIGYRIEQNGFDFSCLGADKKMLAAENLKTLAVRLREFAPSARFVDDYPKIREVLGNVWETEEKHDSKGLIREIFGKFNLGNVTTVNNLKQFTKYSRLQWFLL